VEARSPGRVSACAWSLVGAGAAAADHMLVLPGVLCLTAYVAGEGGHSSPGRVSAYAWEPVWRQRIMCWSCRTSVLERRVSPADVCRPVNRKVLRLRTVCRSGHGGLRSLASERRSCSCYAHLGGGALDIEVQVSR
jgi:hypothetical protein